AGSRASAASISSRVGSPCGPEAGPRRGAVSRVSGARIQAPGLFSRPPNMGPSSAGTVAGAPARGDARPDDAGRLNRCGRRRVNDQPGRFDVLEMETVLELAQPFQFIFEFRNPR